MNKTIEITLLPDDWDILERYGFHFAKNFEEMCENVAAQLRQAEREQFNENE